MLQRLTIEKGTQRADVKTGFDEACGERQIASSLHLKVSAGFLEVLIALEAVVQVFHHAGQRFDQSLVQLCSKKSMIIDFRGWSSLSHAEENERNVTSRHEIMGSVSD